MLEMMQYSAEITREFYRAIVLHDDAKLAELRAYIRANNGEIGNADFVDLDIRDGVTLLCARHRLNTNEAHWNRRAESLNHAHAWDADGVWFPVKDGSQ